MRCFNKRSYFQCSRFGIIKMKGTPIQSRQSFKRPNKPDYDTLYSHKRHKNIISLILYCRKQERALIGSQMNDNLSGFVPGGVRTQHLTTRSCQRNGSDINRWRFHSINAFEQLIARNCRLRRIVLDIYGGNSQFQVLADSRYSCAQSVRAKWSYESSGFGFFN